MNNIAQQTGHTLTLEGRRGWIISDGIAGHLAITRGVAETLGLDIDVKPIAPRIPWRQLAPNGPADPKIMKDLLSDALPDIVLGAGRQTVPVVRALKKRGVFTALFQSPRTIGKSADVIWAPEHDGLNGPHVITTPTPPHRFTPARLETLRRDLPAEIAALPKPRLTVLLGGPGAGYKYDKEVIEDFAASLRSLAGQVGSILITPSRRTPPPLLHAVDEATRQRPRILWQGEGENPYPHFLAAADLFLVTADSVNMTGEACATGRPIFMFMPPGGRAKFHHFHQSLQTHGATRPLTQMASPFTPWHYEPLNAGETIAAEIEKRWASHKVKSR